MNKQLSISTIISKKNLNYIGDVIEMCVEFGVTSFSINRFVSSGKGIKNLNELQINDKQLEEVLSILDIKAKTLGININLTIPIQDCKISQSQFPNFNFGSCYCGRNKRVIDPMRNLRTCEQNPEIIGNLFENNFNKISKSRKVKKINNQNENINCHSCKEYNNCGGGCRFFKENLKSLYTYCLNLNLFLSFQLQVASC